MNLPKSITSLSVTHSMSYHIFPSHESESLWIPRETKWPTGSLLMKLEALQLWVSDAVKHIQFCTPTGCQPQHQPKQLLQVRVLFALIELLIPVRTEQFSFLNFSFTGVMLAHSTVHKCNVNC